MSELRTTLRLPPSEHDFNIARACSEGLKEVLPDRQHVHFKSLQSSEQKKLCTGFFVDLLRANN